MGSRIEEFHPEKTSMVVDVTEIRSPFDFNGLESLLKNLDGNSNGISLGANGMPNFQQPFDYKQFKFGQSNPTYMITDASGKQFVLRRKPLPNNKLVSKSAHAIEREFFMLFGINVCNKDAAPHRIVPVPEVYLLCEDESHIGFVFYLMEYIDGRQIKNPSMPGMNQQDSLAHWQAIMQTITAIHSIDANKLVRCLPAKHFPQFQPEKLAKPLTSSYFQRQIRTLSAVAAGQSKVVKPIPHFEKLCQWLLENAPKDPLKLTLIHGDFKIDNVLFYPNEPKIAAVLDWELCTFGHPSFDLANFLQPFQLPNQLNQLLYKPDKTDMGIEKPGSLDSVYDKLALYQKNLGYNWNDEDPKNNPVDLWNVGFVFGLVRLCVISQGIAMRVAKGNASSGEASGYANLYPYLAKLAVETIEKPPESKM